MSYGVFEVGLSIGVQYHMQACSLPVGGEHSADLIGTVELKPVEALARHQCQLDLGPSVKT